MSCAPPRARRGPLAKILPASGPQATLIGLTTLAVVLGGAGSVLMLANRGYQFSGLLLGLTIAPLVYLVCVRGAAFLLFIGMMVGFTPFISHFGIVITVFAATVRLFHLIVIERRTIKIDRVIVLWSVVGLLVAVTVPRWHLMSLGVWATLHMFLAPLAVYLLFAGGGIDRLGIRRMIRVYLPLLAAYLILQMAGSIVLQNISLSADWRILHRSFDLDWGRHNTIAAVAVLFAAICASSPAMRQHGTPGKRATTTLVLLLAAIPLVIVSRGAIVSLVGGIVVYGALVMLISRKINLSKIVAIGGVAATGMIAVFYQSLQSIIERFTNMSIDLATLARLQMIQNSLLMIKRSPFIGTGPEQASFSDTIAGIHNNPHNLFLQYGAELGIVSVAVIVVLLLIPFVRIISLHRSSPAKGSFALSLFALPMLVAIINSQFELSIASRSYGLVFWTVYAISLTVMAGLRENRIAVGDL